MTEEEYNRQMDAAYAEYCALRAKLKPFGPDKFPTTCDYCKRHIWEGFTDDEDTVVICASCWEDMGK